MKLFLVLISIQVFTAFFGAIVLRMILPVAVREIVEKNSTRLDGSKSDRRRLQEFSSLNRSFIRVYIGLAMVVGITLLAGLIVVGISLPYPNLDQITEIDVEPMDVVPSPFESAQWPLVGVYLISSFVVAPILVTNLYRSAVARYHERAHLRFMDYYRSSAVNNIRKVDDSGSTFKRNSKPNSTSQDSFESSKPR